MRKRKIKIVVESLVLSVLFAFALWTGISFAEPPKEITNKVRFGGGDYPGNEIKTRVAKQILEYLGYEVEYDFYLEAVYYKGLSMGQLDANFGCWYPTHKRYLDPYLEKGQIEVAGVNLNETIYTLAVPKYVWDAGVHSESDLHTHEDKFDYKIYGGPAGEDGNMIMLDAIENNVYNLAGWELVESNTPAMLAAVKRAIKNKEWIVWLGWKPHWMNTVFDMKYLEDPLQIWGPPGIEVVKTITRAGFKEDMPNVFKFLEQFKVTPEIQNEWIYDYGVKKKEADEVAKEWIKNNLRVVDLWVYDVKSVTGERARDAMRNAVEHESK